MSILSVDNISPIGSGTSVTINNAATLVLNNVSVAGVVTATSFVGSGAASLSPSGNADELVIGASNGTRGITIFGATSNIFFGDSGDNDVGQIQYEHSDNSMRINTNAAERLRILSNGAVGINTNNFSSQLNNEVGLAIHGSSNDNCRISITTPTKSNSRIGYFGLSNRFGIDVHYGFEIRDAESSYATRFKINNNGIVSMPFQPLVRYAGSWSYTSWNSHAQVVWGGENEDIGGNFSNGVFTVPSGGEGVYVITAQFIGPNPGSNYFLWQFYKNTTGLNEWVQGYSTNGNAEASSATIAVSCSVGDTLRVAFHTSYQYAYTSGYSTFSIFKVH